MNGAALFHCVGLLVLLGVIDSPSEDAKLTRHSDNWYFTNKPSIRFVSDGNGRAFHMYHGEPRPKGARRVNLSTRWLTQKEIRHLVNDCGYDMAALTSGIYFKGKRDTPEGDVEDVFMGLEAERLTLTNEFTNLRRTTRGGGFHAKTVTRAIAEYLPGISDAHAKAVFDVIYRRRRGTHVALSLGVKPETVYHYTWQVMQRLRDEGSVMLGDEDPDEDV